MNGIFDDLMALEILFGVACLLIGGWVIFRAKGRLPGMTEGMAIPLWLRLVVYIPLLLILLAVGVGLYQAQTQYSQLGF